MTIVIKIITIATRMVSMLVIMLNMTKVLMKKVNKGESPQNAILRPAAYPPAVPPASAFNIETCISWQ